MKQVGIIPLPRVGGALSARWEEVSRDFDFDVKLIGRPYWVIFDSVQTSSSLCYLGVLCVSVVPDVVTITPPQDTENAEIQRRINWAR